MKDFYLLLFRATIGFAMLLGHGLGKLTNFNSLAGKFPDPLSLGSELSLSLVVGAEFFAAFFLIIGLFVRISSIPLIIAMSIAFFVFHGDDPWAKKELTFMYLIPFIYFLLQGGGKLSISRFLHPYIPFRENKIVRWLTD